MAPATSVESTVTWSVVEKTVGESVELSVTA
jgi:hypothetical protein